MRPYLTAALVCLAPLAASAQDTPDARTLGWQVRGDRPSTDASVLSFVEMKPGFHITTNAFSGIMYHPRMNGMGTFEASLKVHFFPPEGTHLESYGVFVGGEDLAGAGQKYVYFLVRNNGQFLIKSRTGTETADIVPWTDHDAVKVLAADAAEGTTALNHLLVRATSERVDFLVNGTVVASRPRAELDVEGVVGIRANHRLNLHVSEIEVSEPMAPAGD